jgi:anti-sigma regulatory factor (Ser/Thr protein kinase)
MAASSGRSPSLTPGHSLAPGPSLAQGPSLAPSPGPSRNPVRAPLLRVMPGRPESASAARELARQVLGDANPATETAMLLVSELVTNSVMHSKSGEPGGSVTVALCEGPASILIQVCDNGGSSEPRVSAMPGNDAEHGYGLLLVDALADRWGTISSPEGRVTWCRVSG